MKQNALKVERFIWIIKKKNVCNKILINHYFYNISQMFFVKIAEILLLITNIDFILYPLGCLK